MGAKIFLDDIRTQPTGFIRCKHVNQVILLISKYPDIDIISLDNDLGENEPEGRKVVDYLEEQKFLNPNFKLPKQVIIHSANPVAKKYMEQVIKKLYGEVND